jgi:DNA-binding MarR family transcriptional regulator
MMPSTRPPAAGPAVHETRAPEPAGTAGQEPEATGDPVAVPAPGTPEAAALADRLRTVLQHLMPLLRAQGVHRDLTPSRLTLLAALGDTGPLRISEVADRMGVALSTVSRMIDMLTSLGWIERRPDPADLRASIVRLTEEGSDVLQSARREHAGKLADEIARLPADLTSRLQDALPALEALAPQKTSEKSHSPQAPGTEEPHVRRSTGRDRHDHRPRR